MSEGHDTRPNCSPNEKGSPSPEFIQASSRTNLQSKNASFGTICYQLSLDYLDSKTTFLEIFSSFSMPVASVHPLLPRSDPSLGELFRHFPAQVWRIFKLIIFGFSIIFAIFAIITGVIALFMSIYVYGPYLIEWLKSGKYKELIKRSREKVGRLKAIERFHSAWDWLKSRSAGANAESVDAEELRPLEGRDSQGRESSVGGETLFEGDEVEDGDEEARKNDEVELDSEDYMKGEP